MNNRQARKNFSSCYMNSLQIFSIRNLNSLQIFSIRNLNSLQIFSIRNLNSLQIFSIRNLNSLQIFSLTNLTNWTIANSLTIWANLRVCHFSCGQSLMHPPYSIANVSPTLFYHVSLARYCIKGTRTTEQGPIWYFVLFLYSCLQVVPVPCVKWSCEVEGQGGQRGLCIVQLAVAAFFFFTAHRSPVFYYFFYSIISALSCTSVARRFRKVWITKQNQQKNRKFCL